MIHHESATVQSQRGKKNFRPCCSCETPADPDESYLLGYPDGRPYWLCGMCDTSLSNVASGLIINGLDPIIVMGMVVAGMRN